MAQAGIGWAQPDVEEQQIARQRMMAQQLRQQSQGELQGQTAGGVYIAPHWTQQLAKALSPLAADMADKRTDERSQAYAEKLKAQGQQDIQDFTGAMQGRAAFETPANEMGDETTMQKAVAPDRAKALAVALGSKNPMLQNAGGSILSSMMPKTPEWTEFKKPDGQGGSIHGFVDKNAPNPLATFQAGGTMPAKLEGVNTGGATTFVNPYAPNAAGAPTIAATANPFKDKLIAGPNGAPIVNQPLLEANKQVAKSGASNVNVKVDTKLGEGLAKEVGPMVQASYDSALGAQKQIGVADNLIKAVDSDKVMAGPGANLRLRGAQFADVLGIGGKDNAEKIANTRSAIQGLAQSTLSQRAALKGQGSVSDFEGKLIAKAASGEIDDMTPAEIKQIAQVNKRLAQQQVQQHRQLTGKLRTHESAKPLVDLFEIPEDAPTGAPKAASVLDAADAILKGGSNGKR